MDKDYKLFARGLLLTTVALGVLFSNIPAARFYTNLVGAFLTLLGLMNVWYGIKEFEKRIQKEQETAQYNVYQRQKYDIANYRMQLQIDLWNSQTRFANAIEKLPRHTLEKFDTLNRMTMELLDGTQPFWRIEATYVDGGGRYLLSQAVEVFTRITPTTDGRWVLPVQHGLSDASFRLAIRDITERLIAKTLAYREYHNGPAYLKGVTPEQAFKALGLDVDTMEALAKI